MYLAVRRTGSVVRVELLTVLERFYSATVTFDNETAAELFRLDADGRIDNAVRLAREEAYAQGWKDAKSKKKRRTYFDALLEIV